MGTQMQRTKEDSSCRVLDSTILPYYTGTVGDKELETTREQTVLHTHE